MQLTVDGRSVFAGTGGRDFDPTRPAVIFLHGAGMDHSVWAMLTRAIAHRQRTVLAVDLPGHGRSEGPALGDIAALADWVIRLMAAAGVARTALVGHSMGSLVALDCAARHPEKVRALALLGAAPAMPVHADLLAAAQANERRALEMVTIWGFGTRAGIGGSRAPGMWMTGGGINLLERAAPGVLHTDLAACDAYGEGLTQAARIACPALLVLGQRDLMTPVKAGVTLAAAISGAGITVLEECGHMMMVEEPDGVLDALLGVV